MDYTIDRNFDSLIDRLQDSDRFMLIWACRLSTGYMVEVLDRTNNTTKSITAHSFEETEDFINELLQGGM